MSTAMKVGIQTLCLKWHTIRGWYRFPAPAHENRFRTFESEHSTFRTSELSNFRNCLLCFRWLSLISNALLTKILNCSEREYVDAVLGWTPSTTNRLSSKNRPPFPKLEWGVTASRMKETKPKEKEVNASLVYCAIDPL